ncbi:hypothetical protein GCM10009557_91070 [Virgisporangium ochraceum]|uniref:Putative restriction endonuclease domain-containing protein n=1 Tax=Virgisporangium ochraceum TaxID=65505 RepID=A0A8J3ZXZ0_9ACTN|nr:Uma2 family endonuclease [Virgisporangium ochraceum]GIJ69515.1 hypothetical protein Voc01_044320 [Virgisporangium ochraceum]
MSAATIGAQMPPEIILDDVAAMAAADEHHRSTYAGIDGLLLAIEVISPDSEVIDRVSKKSEYAAAGVPRYWIVDRDKANTVEFQVLGTDSYAAEREPAPLAWLLNQPVPPLA